MTSRPTTFPASARSNAAAYTIDVDGLPVRITRKAIKNMYLRVKPPQGDVVVSAPTRMPDAQIAEFVRQRHGWIVEQRRRMAKARQAGANGNNLGGGDDTVGSAGDDAGTITANGTTGEVWTEERRRQAADAINAQLPALLAHWGPIIGRTPTHITLRTMTTRWGSCTPRTGRIRLNLQLGLMEPRFLEYVLVHEMTHLWAGGHGAEFQRRMSQYLPDWRTLRHELNRYAAL